MTPFSNLPNHLYLRRVVAVAAAHATSVRVPDILRCQIVHDQCEAIVQVADMLPATYKSMGEKYKSAFVRLLAEPYDDTDPVFLHRMVLTLD